MNTRQKGKEAEDFVKEYLEQNGYNVINMNYYSRYGEIDLIAKDNEYIIFVEVKARKKNTMVKAQEAVTKSKQKKIIKTSLIYLMENQVDLQTRFDVVEVEFIGERIDKGSINHIKNAFWQEDGYAFF